MPWHAVQAEIEASRFEIEKAKSQVKIYSNRGLDTSWKWRLANLTDEQLERELELVARQKEMARLGAAMSPTNNDMMS